jgi:thimet oligopeptidase
MKNFIRILFLSGILLLVFYPKQNVAIGIPAPADEKPKLASGNPLLPEPEQLFDFAKVDTKAITAAAMASEKRVDSIIAGFLQYKNFPRTFANTMSPLDEIYNTLQKAASVYELMSETSTDKGVRDLSGEMLGKFNTKTDELLQNQQLYDAVKAYSTTDEAKNLTGERAFFVKRLLQEFNLNGMGLSISDRDTLKMLNSKLNDLSVQFGKNIAEDKTKVEFYNGKDVTGLPQDFLNGFLIPSGTGGYSFDLSTPTYNEFMTDCSNEASRKKMYVAKMNVGGLANEKLLVEIIKLRTRKAQLLGFKTYSQYATSDIMSQNTETVWKFEKGLATDLRPKAQQDLSLMENDKLKDHPGEKTKPVIYPYDWMYYQNMELKNRYNVDAEKVKEYFEMQNTIDGIFTVYQKLYNLSFVEDKNASVWQQDVKAYSVFDNATKQIIGYFYLDLFPRENKYNHFGCFGLTGSKTYPNGKKQMHCAALVCNFPPSTADKPSLLPHSQVVTFFHEFGHLIHCMLSETELAYFAGTNVATDFVEAPSQIMENWVWQKDVLSLFAKHYKTGQVIPDSLLNNMIAARNLNSGLITLQQVFYGTLDFTLNDGYAPKSADDIISKTKELQNSITFYPWVDGTHFAGTFGHLTGYGSKYYGYLWSLVYASDMFSEFQKTSPLDPATGKRYRENVLSKGGSNDAIKLVGNFLGREPNNAAFLKQIGL